jgi:hypothetical protein
MDSKRVNLAPLILFRYNLADPAPALVYRDAYYAIFELARAASYFSTLDGRCRLTPVSREDVAADCRAADRLVRRELYFPGWTAQRDGAPEGIKPYNSIFQVVDLPAGHSVYRFRYAPSGISWAYAATITGLLALAAACRPRPRPV